MRGSRFTPLPLLLALAVLIGCERDDEIRTYQAPKERAVAQVTGPPASAGGADAPAPARDEKPTFTVPAGWKDVRGQGMRFASFEVSPDDPTALVTVIPLGRESGDLLANVVRWEGQLGLPPSTAEDLPKVTKPIDVNGVPVTTVDLRGEKLWTRAAIVPRGERVWFFKLTGNPKTVEAQAGNFDAFVKSIRFGGSVTEPPATVPPAEAGGPVSTRATGEPRWEAPESWVQQPQRPMRFATFFTSQDPGAPEVVVSSFGAFGTMKDNINRWRNMVGLAPVDDEKEQPVEKITVAGRDGALFDMTGKAQDAQPARRLLIAMVPAGESVWFFRMLGPADAVQQQRANFDAFLKSVRFE